MKRFLKHPWVQIVLCWLVAQYIRFVYVTTRWETVMLGNKAGEAPLYDHPSDGFRDEPVVVTFWHGRLLMLNLFPHAIRPSHILISSHRDGTLIARVSRHLKHHVISGSSSRGGARAVIEMIRRLKEGTHVAITPDGPRGPRMRAAMGAITVAKKSGAAIIPLGYAVTRYRYINSWDQFMLAYPFGRGVFTVGNPIVIPADADALEMERYRKKLESALIHITNEANKIVGAALVEPEADDIPPAKAKASSQKTKQAKEKAI